MKQRASAKPTVRRGNRSSSAANEAGNSVKDSGSLGDYWQAIIDSLEDELMVVTETTAS